MNKEKELDHISTEIKKLLSKLEGMFWEVSVYPSHDVNIKSHSKYYSNWEEDNKTWLFHGTRVLYYKICLFLELKSVPKYLKQFMVKYQPIIDNKEKVMKSRAPLYSEIEPSMIIHDEFRDFLGAFHEFDYTLPKKQETNKLKLILENTNSIVSRTGTTVTNESSIYKPVKWFVEIVFPATRGLGKARFIKKFQTYLPDILVPEISSAVEYKLIRKGNNVEKYLDQIKTDALNYDGDPEYRFFIAVVYFEDKTELNQAAFKNAVNEKSFPDNWTILAL